MAARKVLVRINGQTVQLPAGDTIAGLLAMRVETVSTTSVGQTSYTIPNGYTVGAILVYFNGALQQPADFTATNGTTVVLAVGALSMSDVMSVVVIGAIRTVDDAFGMFTVATLPPATANTAKMRYCTDMAGAPGFVFSNGTKWLRVVDNTEVTT